MSHDPTDGAGNGSFAPDNARQMIETASAYAQREMLPEARQALQRARTALERRSDVGPAHWCNACLVALEIAARGGDVQGMEAEAAQLRSLSGGGQYWSEQARTRIGKSSGRVDPARLDRVFAVLAGSAAPTTTAPAASEPPAGDPAPALRAPAAPEGTGRGLIAPIQRPAPAPEPPPARAEPASARPHAEPAPAQPVAEVPARAPAPTPDAAAQVQPRHEAEAPTSAAEPSRNAEAPESAAQASRAPEAPAAAQPPRAFETSADAMQQHVAELQAAPVQRTDEPAPRAPENQPRLPDTVPFASAPAQPRTTESQPWHTPAEPAHAQEPVERAFRAAAWGGAPWSASVPEEPPMDRLPAESISSSAPEGDPGFYMPEDSGNEWMDRLAELADVADDDLPLIFVHDEGDDPGPMDARLRVTPDRTDAVELLRSFVDHMTRWRDDVSDEEAENFYDLGTSFLDMEQWESAVKVFDQAMRNPGTRVAAAEGYLRALIGMGDHHAAFGAAGMALSNLASAGEPLSGIFFLRGRAAEQIGDPREARRCYQEALRIDRFFADARERLAALEE